jgi:hypothetical protein
MAGKYFLPVAKLLSVPKPLDSRPAVVYKPKEQKS